MLLKRFGLTKIVAMVLVIVMSMFAVSCKENANTSADTASTAVRTISVEDNSQYVKDVEKVLSTADEFYFDEENCNVYATETTTLQGKAFNTGNSEVKMVYDASYDEESGLIHLTIEGYNMSGEIVLEEKYLVAPIYEEEADTFDAEILTESGEIYWLSDLMPKKVQSCFFFSIAIGLGALLTKAIIAVSVACVAVGTAGLVAYGTQAVIDAARNASTSTSNSNPNVVGGKLLRKIPIEAAIMATISEISEDNRVYQLAYVDRYGKLEIMDLKLNYLEAYATLIATGVIHRGNTSILRRLIAGVILSIDMEDIAETIRYSKVSEDVLGIYTFEKADAAKLAYAAGGFFNDEEVSEIHNDNPGCGYYYHFHDINHVMHVWYGRPQ